MDWIESNRRRTGASLVEIIVVIGIITILFGLLIPAVQRVRENSLRITSMNNLKQIMLATHSYAAANRDFVPGIDGSNPLTGAPGVSVFLAIMPHLDNGNVYQEYQAKYPPGYSPPPGDGWVNVGGITGKPAKLLFPEVVAGDGYVVSTFVSPMDPTISQRPQGRTSYAANAVGFDYQMKLPTSFRDGTAYTIAFAEHYAYRCGGQIEFSWVTGPVTGTPRDGTLATYYDSPATFAHREMGDVYPIQDGMMARASIPGLTFQVRPKITEADPRIAQTPHSSGMLSAFMDGGVRSLSPGMSEPIYWSLVTPRGGEVVDAGW